MGCATAAPGLIALLHRLGFDYRKPGNCLADSPTPNRKPSSTATRSCSTRWMSMKPLSLSMPFILSIKRGRSVAGFAEASPSPCSRRPAANGLNIHGAINLETGHTQMVDTAKGERRKLPQAACRDRRAPIPQSAASTSFSTTPAITMQTSSKSGSRHRAQSRAALPSALLSPSRSHRTVVGPDARKRHSQPRLQDLPRVSTSDHHLLAV